LGVTPFKKTRGLYLERKKNQPFIKKREREREREKQLASIRRRSKKI
jgi:hypothetical protein